jgi:hypothetical protein
MIESGLGSKESCNFRLAGQSCSREDDIQWLAGTGLQGRCVCSLGGTDDPRLNESVKPELFNVIAR